MMIKRNGNEYTLLYIILFIWIIIIFGFSICPGSVSHAQSRTVNAIISFITNHHASGFLKGLQNIFNKIYKNTEKIDSEGVIRKLGHFSEYFVLGMITCITFLFFVQRTKSLIFFIFIGPIVALTDEKFIQKYLTVGRTSSYIDMALDCFSFYLAAFLVSLIFKCIGLIKSYRSAKQT